MLATLAALHLVVVNQVAPPREVTPADALHEETVPERGVPAPVEITARPAETARPPATAHPAAAVAVENPPLPSKAAPPPWSPPPEPATAHPAAPIAMENPPLPSKAPASPFAPPAQPEAAQAAPPAAAEPVPLPRPPAGPVLPPAPADGGTASPPTAAPPPPAGAPPRLLSLLSGETLQGGSTALAWAGWSELGIAYGQGLSPKDDLGAFLDYDWATSEAVLGLAYRRSVGRSGGWDMASRLSAGYYTNLGSTLVEDENRSDRGVEVTPGLSVSRSGRAGVFSAIVEGPITVTWKYGAGLLFAPRLTLSFETPVHHEVTVGFRAGAAYRAGAGEAPLTLGSPEFVFHVLAGYQLL